MANFCHTNGVAKAQTSNAFSRTGYTFKGWSTTTDSTVEYTNGQSVSNLTATNGGTVNLYAVWTANTYTVTFNGLRVILLLLGTKSVTYDSTYGTLPSPTRTGYTFKSW